MQALRPRSCRRLAFEESFNEVLDPEDDIYQDNYEPDEDEPHPLRMAEWKLKLRPYLGWSRKENYLVFERNGAVFTSEGEEGTWWFDVAGLQWDVNIKGIPHHFKSELHWNVFGTEPRMYRGTVTRDRSPSSPLPPWLFRPVVATFEGHGVGEDTADLSYGHRMEENASQERPPTRLDRA
ncbi:unnamed protein product [Chrysoparadoxa australica]